ncbi:MAG: hypothetical protein AB3N24_21330 [Leisingera sp.]
MIWKKLIPVFALTACVKPSLPVDDTYTASRRATVGNEFESYSTLVRSFAKGEDGERVEFAGAVCSASNALVSVKSVTTPALVEMPMYLQADRFKNQGKPPALNWRCSYQGKVVKLTTEAASGRGNTVVYGTSTYNASTGTYSQPTTYQLTSRLSSTLPWGYPHIELDF